MLGSHMAGGNSTEGRVKDDFYGTPKEATHSIMQALRPRLKEIEHRTIHEPCCDEGAMGKVMIEYGLKVLGTDINPRGYGYQKDFQKIASNGKKPVITNPPFSLAEELIVRSLEIWESDFLVLLLKSTYFHAGERQALFERHKPTNIFALPWRLDFHNLGRPTMECSWFVWDYRNEKPDCCDYQIAPNLNPKKRASKPA